MLLRRKYLTAHRKLQGDLIGRRAWPQIMIAQVNQAMAGNTAAAKFVAERAWPEETQPGGGLSVEEMLRQTFSDSEEEEAGPLSTMWRIEGRPD